ncbi:YjcZ family sporulation protein [Fictibacillus nanhaiensis]|uniref:Sporulation protein YjcZ n=2 Tax=Fictibacillus TaxID=1329200 RepID=A0A168VQA0_9BACL|nr:YjcZ family sporulation protein [Fictibacillus phosphorivorans]ANC75515.1 sporulation protein YjcZ [Fictibacillus phosphorivorans]MBN3552818.1 YjcZ family sporulation protein [Fictibacillus nanhaiensis]MQR93879.1 YjcZ family sporulation protein [Fictibacillus phosphorivorans]
MFGKRQKQERNWGYPGYGYGCYTPCGYGYGGYGGGGGVFALIVVLFILLIIIGASWR